MYQFQLPAHDEQHIPPTRLQVQEQHLREQKRRYLLLTAGKIQPVLPPVINALRARIGGLLISIGSWLSRPEAAGRGQPALTARQ